jgi:phosphopantothenoylcysteine decarboxylase/phosphopantothenate--cysteine ligase
VRILNNEHLDFKDKKILVTAGPTFEMIDPVRFIGNYSSGKMGFAVANAAAQRGAEVTLISGPTYLPTPRNVNRVNVESAEQMFNAVLRNKTNADVIIAAAAVADFTPVHLSYQKIKKEKFGREIPPIKLKKTKDILHHLGKEKGKEVLVGFALETQDGLRSAKEKLKSKNLDLVVLNNPLQEGAGFGFDTNIVTLISKKGKIEKLKKMSKYDAANEILDRVARIINK